tara:strand:- start:774 stop:1556 length:783 start_codon:yes stop_codon:yes gene_type:complete
MRNSLLVAAAGLALSSAAMGAASGGGQATGGTTAQGTQQAPLPPCEYKTRMNFSIGDGTTGALHVRRSRLKDAPAPTTELRMTIEAPITKAHSDRAEGIVKVTLGVADGYLPPAAEGAAAARPGLQWVHVKSRQLQGTSRDHPAYKRKPKPAVRWSVGGKTLMGDGFSPDGDAFFVLSPADGDNAGVTDPAKLFTGGDWTFETSKGFEDSWGDYTIPFAFLSGIIVDIGKVMASIDKAAANGECTIGTSFGEMQRSDIFY